MYWRRKFGPLVIQTGFGYGWMLFARRLYFTWKDTCTDDGPGDLWNLTLGRLNVSWPWNERDSRAMFEAHCRADDEEVD